MAAKQTEIYFRSQIKKEEEEEGGDSCGVCCWWLLNGGKIMKVCKKILTHIYLEEVRPLFLSLFSCASSRSALAVGDEGSIEPSK